MLKKSNINVQGTLDVIFRDGRYGRFPVGVLHTPFGSFACRDKWLETLDTGSFDGEFEIASIALSGYMTQGAVREQRTFIKAVVSAYCLETVSDDVADSEYSALDDPILDEDNTEKPAVIAEIDEVSHADAPIVANVDDEQPLDEMVLFIREQLHIVGNDTQWNNGDVLSIPADLGRAEQRKIRDYQIDEGYKMTDPINRLWTMNDNVREVAHA